MRFSYFILIIFFIFSLCFFPCESVGPEELLFFEKLIVLNPNLNQLIPLNDTLCSFRYNLIQISCTSNSISTLLLINVRLPEEIGNLQQLKELTVYGLIGDLPQNLSTCTNLISLNIYSSVSQTIGLPENLCSVTTLVLFTEASYIPSCLSTTLTSVFFVSRQPYFFNIGRIFTNLYSIILYETYVPPFHTWFNSSSAILNFMIENSVIQSFDMFEVLQFVPEIAFRNITILEPLSAVSLNVTNIQKLTIVDTNLLSFPDLINCSALEELVLTSNNIRDLPPVFPDCPNLTRLTISNNLITEFPNWNLRLSYADFRNNKISKFPDSQWNFFDMNSDILLSLSNNNISTFPSYFMSYTWTFSQLDISSNPLEISGPGFEGPDFVVSPSSSVKIKQLLMNNCSIENISISMLTRLSTTLITILMNDNKITQFPEELTTVLTNLYGVMLSNNLIQTIPTLSRRINILDLSNNLITEVNNNLLYNTSVLLSLSNNNLNTWNVIPSPGTIDVLLLKNTNLTSIPEVLQGSLVVNTKLDLSDNPFSTSIDNLNVSQDLQELYIQNTSLTKLYETFFQALNRGGKLQTLDLSSNPILFDTVENPNSNSNIDIIQRYFLYSRAVGDRILLMNVSRTGLDTMFKNISDVQNINVVDFSHNKLTQVPNLYGLPIYSLDLSYNLIQSIPPMSLPLFDQLNLDGNPLDLCQTPLMYKGLKYPPQSNFTDFEIYDLHQTLVNSQISIQNLNISQHTLSNLYTCGCLMPYLNKSLNFNFLKPLDYCSPKCLGNPPTPQAICNGTHWIIKDISNIPTIKITGPTMIEGNLTTNSTQGGIVFEGLNPEGTVIVIGCYESQIPITIELTPEDVERLSKLSDRERKFLLIKALGGKCQSNHSTSSLPPLKINQSGNNCKKVNGKLEATNDSIDGSYQLSGVFRIDSLKCKVWWIVLISVIGALIILGVVGGIIYITTIRQKMFKKK